MYKILVVISTFMLSSLAMAQEKQALLVSAKSVKSFQHSYYNAKSKIVSTKIVTRKGGYKTSVATVLVYGNIEGNLCLDNKVSLNVKSLKQDYRGSVWKENLELSFSTYQQHYGKQPMMIGSTFHKGCTLHGEIRPFAMQVAFEGLLSNNVNETSKSGVFNVILRNAHPNLESYKFRVTFNGKTKEWKISDI